MVAKRRTGSRETPPARTPGRRRKNLERAMFKVSPEQHAKLNDTAIRARLDRRPNAAEGASFIVRRLVQDWIERGAKWPEER